jgi:hypothetical protein
MATAAPTRLLPPPLPPSPPPPPPPVTTPGIITLNNRVTGVCHGWIWAAGIHKMVVHGSRCHMKAKPQAAAG